MEINKKPYPLSSLNGLKDKINTQSHYQRPPVWNKQQKQLLIDSILRGYDIPKVYVKKEPSDSKYELEVIDGQQRLLAIWGYFNNDFGLPNDAEPIDGIECASKKIEKLDINLRAKLDIYTIDFVIVTEAIQNAETDEIGDLFLRLQNGEPLKPREKRNAMPGNMKDFVKDDIAKHDFFEKSYSLPNNRYSYDQLAAQMVCLELSLEKSENKPTSVSAPELKKMYEENKDFELKGATARKVEKVLDYLHSAFPQKIPELVNHSSIALYCLASNLIKFYDYKDTEEKFGRWFKKFEHERREAENNPSIDSTLKEQIKDYETKTRNSSDKQPQIEYRLNMMQKSFFLENPDIKKKDDNRVFAHEQKVAIFWRDEAKCQVKLKCDGARMLDWDESEIDHKIPHSRGGETTVANGQLACIACNRAKSDKL